MTRKPLQLLPVGQSDDSAALYLEGLAPASARIMRSRLEAIGRILLGMAPSVRPRRVAGRRLWLDLGRVPWSSVTADDARHVRDVLLGGEQSRHSIGCALGGLRGVLRAAGVLTVAHLDALRVDHQGEGVGRSVAEVVRSWRADEQAQLAASEFHIVPDPTRGRDGRWISRRTA